MDGDITLWSKIVLLYKSVPLVVWQTFNFAVLIWILVKFGGKPMKAFLENRRNAVKDRIDETSRMLAEAESLKNAYAEKLNRLDGEIEELKKTLSDEAQREKARIIAEAEQVAARIHEQTRLTYEQELRDVKNNIREEIARLAVEKAEQLIAEKVAKSDHDHMLDDFITKLRSMN